MKLCFVLVTRNRTDHAIAAIRALLTQESAEPFDLVVSDNSELAEDARRLEEYCRSTGDSRLIYIRPEAPMAMPAHWNWAIEQAMARSDATHFGVQYDRKLWKPGELRVFHAACASDPRTTVAYGCDIAFLRGQAVEAWATPVTGRLYDIRTSTIVHLTSRGMVHQLGSAYPLLANCMVPRPALERVRARFGTICDSATPDAGFTYRLCALDERYLYLDRASVLVHGSRLSHGASYLRGDGSGTHGDFRKLWGDRPWLDAAPIPGLDLGWNIVFHEYTLVQRVVGEVQFPPIDRAGYLRELAFGLAWIDDPVRQKEMRRILGEHGWREDARPPLRRLLSRLRGAVRRKPMPPPQLPVPTFPGDDEALQYLLQPQPFADQNPRLAPLEPVEVPFRA
ncbi:MAG TPA: hypothetical protein VNI54_13655 [Thermoanaerobaculia bacterium]|nr:hypothetical protein [Thermoanaerobaculia bacterium]